MTDEEMRLECLKIAMNLNDPHASKMEMAMAVWGFVKTGRLPTLGEVRRTATSLQPTET